ncbi:hypothetical protein BC826DRAFT_994839, partial [Russula brevipes]
IASVGKPSRLNEASTRLSTSTDRGPSSACPGNSKTGQFVSHSGRFKRRASDCPSVTSQFTERPREAPVDTVLQHWPFGASAGTREDRVGIIVRCVRRLIIDSACEIHSWWI